jgi:hypothetical protein
MPKFNCGTIDYHPCWNMMRQESFSPGDICIGEPILDHYCHAFLIEFHTVRFISNVASQYWDVVSGHRLCSESSYEQKLRRKKYVRFSVPLNVLRFVLEVRLKTPVGRDVNCISL